MINSDKTVLMEEFNSALSETLRCLATTATNLQNVSKVIQNFTTLLDNQQSLNKKTQDSTTKEKEKKTRAKRDPNAPKRPLTSYFQYLKVAREQIVREFPDLDFRGIQTKLKEKWDAMNDSEKEVYHRLYREELPQFEKDLQEYNNKKGIVPAVRKRNFATLKSAETSLVHSENDEKDNEEEEIEQVGLNEVAENVKDIDEEGGESGSDVSDSADDGEMDEIDEEGGEMDDNDVQAKKIGSFETTVVKNESEEGEKATMENNTKINLERKKMEVNSENKETDGKIKSSIKGTPFKDVIQSPKLDGILSPSKKKIKYED